MIVSNTRKRFTYIPILKWKAGEQQALRDLFAADKSLVTPLAEITPAPWDYVRDQPTKTIDAQIGDVPEQILKHWGTDDIFIDLVHIDPADRLANGAHPVTSIFAAMRSQKIAAIPVTSVNRDGTYQAAVASVVATDKRGVCIRLSDEEAFSENLPALLASLLTLLVVAPSDVDLVIDMNAMVAGEERRAAAAIRGLLHSLPHINLWRTITCAGSAFPENMTNLAAGIHTIPRSEWTCWALLASTRASLPRLPTFGDYAIAHPALVELDPRIITMSANIRYTVTDGWLILRGRSIEKHGSDQYHVFCQTLITRPEYAGNSFSAGDDHINRCASAATGPGNATTWRRVGTNHHITFVLRQIANSSYPSNTGASTSGSQ
ncbi:MAG TPA: beta family protein [Polyangium sp.]|nr:beta family protein [Polyangium sp.]